MPSGLGMPSRGTHALSPSSWTAEWLPRLVTGETEESWNSDLQKARGRRDARLGQQQRLLSCGAGNGLIVVEACVVRPLCGVR